MATGEWLRVFWAICFESSVLDKICHYQQAIKSDCPSGSVRWQPRENFHLTLCFIAKLPSEQLTSMQARVAAACREIASFSLTLGSAAGFPYGVRARALALQVTENPQLSHLAEVLKRQVAACDLSVEAKAFKPHVTLARFKKPMSVEISQDFEETLQVTHIELLQSTLAPEGAHYQSLYRVGFL